MSKTSETIETLNLLQRTVDYLYRLPVVPMTYALCKEIEAHLADPSIAAAKREAIHLERMQSTRVAQCFDPGGQVMLDVVVTADEVTCRIPEISLPPSQSDSFMAQLHEGVTIRLNHLRLEF